MAQSVTLGGDRVGSGNKQKVQIKNYERSTHDLSYVWRSTAAAGTLIPFLSELALPGDNWEIDLNVDVMTHPTIGPLFGSYKVQLDLFQIPIRLYQAQLHMNMLGIGMKMNTIKLPQLVLETEPLTNSEKVTLIEDNKYDNHQINPSSVLSYLNIRGVGENTTNEVATREFNAIPLLAYWDIYKGYYANKQEENGMVIHAPAIGQTYDIKDVEFQIGSTTTDLPKINEAGGGTNTFTVGAVNPQLRVELIEESPYSEKLINELVIYLGGASIPQGIEIIDLTQRGYGVLAKDFFRTMGVIPIQPKIISFSGSDWEKPNSTDPWEGFIYGWSTIGQVEGSKEIEIHQFPLKNIDEMRTMILQHKGASAWTLDKTSIAPYGMLLNGGELSDGSYKYSKQSTQEGLALKTYQSDLFNNWVSTEWIDGDGGINELTRVSAEEGYITIDDLNLSRKLYDVMMRIAVSGGTYDDWLNATYTHDRVKSIESPMYMGGMSTELIFQEVVSTAAVPTEPLGSLAGQGKISGKRKGGNSRIRVDEPSYIMGIVSLTPRLDYSQGNKWDTGLKTMDDFHKPGLDQIGFQDLITEQMAWYDTEIGEDGEITQHSAGKQPAWVNYMTNVNQTRGNFAKANDQMWMTLNRKYETDTETMRIKDLTTYIDPSKFNHIFADTRLDAQNFWVQIAVGAQVRRKMSAKLMPNL